MSSGPVSPALQSRSRRRDLTEVAVAYLLILLVLWTPRPWQRVLYWLPVLWIAGATWMSFPGPDALGLRRANLLRSLWIAVVAAAVSAGTLVWAAHLRTLRAPLTPLGFARSYAGYAVWALVQQFLMMSFFLTRLLRCFGRAGWAVLTTAGIFTLAHLPNPVLTPLTLIWGLVGCWHFLRYRNLYPLAVAHAILGITVAIGLPGYVTHNMRVGLGYLSYRRPHWHHRSHTDQIASTHAWVMADAATRRSWRHARP